MIFIATSCRDTLSTAAFFPEQIYAPGNQRPNDEKCQSRVKSIAHFYLQKEDSVVNGTGSEQRAMQATSAIARSLIVFIIIFQKTSSGSFFSPLYGVQSSTKEA